MEGEAYSLEEGLHNLAAARKLHNPTFLVRKLVGVAPNSYVVALGSCVVAPNSFMAALGSCAVAPNSCVVALNSFVADPDPKTVLSSMDDLHGANPYYYVRELSHFPFEAFNFSSYCLLLLQQIYLEPCLVAD